MFKIINSISLFSIFLLGFVLLVFGKGGIIDLIHLSAKGSSYDGIVIYSQNHSRRSRRIEFELELNGATLLITESVPKYDFLNPKTDYLIGETITVIVDSERNLYYPEAALLESIIKTSILAVTSALISLYFVSLFFQIIKNKKGRDSEDEFEIYFQCKPGEKVSWIKPTVKRKMIEDLSAQISHEKLSAGGIYGISINNNFIEISMFDGKYQCRSSINKHEDFFFVKNIGDYLRIVEEVFRND